MSLEKKIFIKKNISAAKAVLASMWHLRESGREKLLSHKYIKIFCEGKHKNTHRSSISRLCEAKLVKRGYNNTLLLTEEGQRRALPAFIEVEAALHRFNLKREAASRRRESEGGKAPSEVWDGGWRIVFFDIPEKKRKYRDYLRKIIKLIGFYELQRSIWVYPYPVPQFLQDLIFENNIKPHVRFITTNSIDNDRDLRIIFGLLRADQ